MKTKIILCFIGLAMTLSSYSQIKVFAGGSVSIGSTASPAGSGMNHLIVGSKTAFPSSTSTFTSVAVIRGNNAYSGATTPDYTWWGNDQTGFFHPAQNIIGFAINGAETMRLNGSGNLLIGSTTDLSNRLVLTGTSNQGVQSSWASHTGDYGYCQANHVNRSLTKAYAVLSSATGTEVENFVVFGSGAVWGLSYTSWSDKNLKENIDSLQDALKKIKQLKGVSYNFKPSAVGPGITKKEIGLIAQDVETVIPEVVNTSDKGIKGVMYQNLIPLLIEAIKEQDKKISDLQSDLNNCCNKKSSERTSGNTSAGNSLPNAESYTGDSYLKQNVPNPFNKETLIDYFVAERNASSSIIVFDMSGKLLKTFKLNGNGKGSITISGNEFSPGMYYYSLVINAKEVGTKKMILTE
jgi:hypothetical protein